MQVYIEALNLDLKNTSRRIETYEVEFAKRIEEIQVWPLLHFYFLLASLRVFFKANTIKMGWWPCLEEIQTKLLEGGQLKLQRLAIPATQVYPLFIKLAETWRGLQDETLVLSR